MYSACMQKNSTDKKCPNCASNRLVVATNRNSVSHVSFSISAAVVGYPHACCDCGLISMWIDTTDLKQKDMLEKLWQKLNG